MKKLTASEKRKKRRQKNVLLSQTEQSDKVLAQMQGGFRGVGNFFASNDDFVRLPSSNSISGLAEWDFKICGIFENQQSNIKLTI